MTENTKVRVELRGAARDLFTCTAGEVLLDGPAGTGKSLAALFRLHLAALKYPRTRCLIVRKTGKSLGSTTLVTFENKVAREAIDQRIVRWYGGSQREAACYRYSNGSKIVVGGLDDPTKIMSSDYDLVFTDEATELTIDDWEAITTRLRNGNLPWQQVIAAANPGHPKHWLNKRAGTATCPRLISRHQDNPRYYTADGQPTEAGVAYLNTLANLTGVRKLRLADGKWAAADGIIYEDFDPAIHVIDRIPIPDHWQRWWAVDFGYVHPFVLQCWAADGDGRLFRYREIYMTGRLVEDHARQILTLVTAPVEGVKQVPDEHPRDALAARRRRWIEPQPQAVLCDHDAEDRATLDRHLGFSTRPAKKSVSDGIQAVQARLRVQGDGRPRIFFLRDSLVEVDQALELAEKPTCTEDELPGYQWAIKPGTGELKEEPVKVDDDGADTMRYVVAEQDFGRRPRYRSFAM